MLANATKEKLNFFLLLLLSITITYIPWEFIRSYDFVDLQRNLDKYRQFKYLDRNINFSNVTSEPLWTYLNYFFSHANILAEYFFGFIATFCFYVFSHFIYKKTKNIIYCLLLINPIMLDFVLSQQRSCFAFSLLICFSHSKFFLKFFTYIPIFLIHTLGVVIVFIDELTEHAQKFFQNSRTRKLFFSAITAFSLAFLTVYGREFILGYFNDRRAYEYDAGANSILYALPWLMYSQIILFKSKDIKSSVIAAIYLMIFFWCSVFEFYGSRYLAIGMPLFYVSLSYVPKNTWLLLVLILHQLLLLYIWLKL